MDTKNYFLLMIKHLTNPKTAFFAVIWGSLKAKLAEKIIKIFKFFLLT